MARRDEIAERLSAEGERRENARAEAKAASTEIAKLAPRALRAGLSKVEIARRARISRTALDDMLR